jgi:hypothetical protein
MTAGDLGFSFRTTKSGDVAIRRGAGWWRSIDAEAGGANDRRRGTWHHQTPPTVGQVNGKPEE